MSYVILEWNQASRQPAVIDTDTYDERGDAVEQARILLKANRANNRREGYSVHELDEIPEWQGEDDNATTRDADLPATAPESLPDAEGEEAWHEFHDGPWAGQRAQVETSPDAYEHLVPYRPQVGVGEWVPADAHRDCYVRTGSYGETVVMTWRQT